MKDLKKCIFLNSEIDLKNIRQENLQQTDNLKKQLDNRVIQLSQDQIIALLKEERDKYKDSFVEADVRLQATQQELKKFSEKYDQSIEKLKGESDYQIKKYQDTNSELQIKLSNNEIFVKRQEEYSKHKQNLEQELEQLKYQMNVTFLQKNIVAEKDRQMILKTDIIQKNMLSQISDIRKSILNVKQDQFDATVRLTMLQNQQLSQELEYQSRQTERLLLKCKKMEEQNKTYKREIDIQKMIQDEIIKKQLLLKQQDKSFLEQSKFTLNNSQQDSKIIIDENYDFQSTVNLNIQIKMFEKQQKNLEKKYTKLQNDYELIKLECETLQKKLSTRKNTLRNLSDIIIDFIETTQEKDVQNLVYKLNLTQIQKNSLTTKDKEALLYILLQQMKGYINKNALQIKDHKQIKIQIMDGHGNTSYNELPKIASSLKSPQQQKGYLFHSFNKPTMDTELTKLESSIQDESKLRSSYQQDN